MPEQGLSSFFWIAGATPAERFVDIVAPHPWRTKIKIPKQTSALALLFLACSPLLVTSATADDAGYFGWSITPYVWAPTTKMDLTFRDTGIGSGEITFSDLLDVLDAALMVHVEGGKGDWSIFGDLTYLSTSETDVRAVFTIDVDGEQTFLDAAVAHWVGGVGSPLSVFAGLRYSGFDDRYDFRLTSDNSLVSQQRSKSDYYDALLGLRYRFDFSDRWALLTHGDLSFGESEGTFLLRADFAYTVGKRQLNRILFGYQYKEAEFKDGDLVTDFSYNGPLAGFNFRF
jgi:hypothetical protein